MSAEIRGEDVMKLIEQFLKENGLNQTAAMLQQESQVSANILDNPHTLLLNIREGRWEPVLREVTQLKLPLSKAMDL